jgi:peptidoglycan/LPS O-acetylase OafA/YrhL
MLVADDRAPSQDKIAPAAAAATTAHQTFLQTKTFSSLDGVRAFCCLLVVKSHLGWITGIRIFDTPGLGVEMFFAISGFLIVTLLIRERTKTGTISIPKFYARRSLRIFPVYYGSILAVLSVTSLLAVVHKPGPFLFYRFAFVVLLTYTQDFVPANLGDFHPCWSLAMEEQFYLAWPTVEKFTSARVRWIILAGVIVVSELTNFGVFRGLIQRIYHDPQAIYMPLYLATFTPIALGVCLAHVLNNPRTYRVAYRVLGYRWAPVLWMTVLALLFRFGPSDLSGLPRLLIHLTVALLLASVVIREDSFAAPVLTFPLLARIGAISYGLYVYHQWIITFSKRFVERFVHWVGVPQISSFLYFAITGALCILFADLSFRWFEKPILRLRSRFQS